MIFVLRYSFLRVLLPGKMGDVALVTAASTNATPCQFRSVPRATKCRTSFKACLFKAKARYLPEELRLGLGFGDDDVGPCRSKTGRGDVVQRFMHRTSRAA